MRRFMPILSAFAASALLSLSLASAQEVPSLPEGHIYELAMRYVVDQEGFTNLRPQLNALVEESAPDLTLFSGEFASIFGLAPELDSERPIMVGISQYSSAADYFAVGTALGEDPLVMEYFATIETIQNVLMLPVNSEAIDATELATCGALEVAVRDISGYEDLSDFYASMEAFIKVLGAQEGVVREYQFISIEGTHFVGMTCYASVEAFGALSQDPTLLNDPAVGAIFTKYPPMVAQITVPVTETEASAQEAPALPEGHIYELAMRYVVDQEGFTNLRPQLNALVEEAAPDLTLFSGEFASIFGLAPELDSERPIMVGISQYSSAADYFTVGTALGEDPLVMEYFATIETIQNVLMLPVNSEAIDATELATCGALEVAVRDISGYEDLNDFYASMEAFIKVLGVQEGVVREYQFLSIEGTHFVGMTCYASVEAFGALSQDPTLLNDPAVGAIFTKYPPMVAQITVPVTED